MDSSVVPDLNQRIYPISGYEDEDLYQATIDAKMNEIQDRREKSTHYEIINKQIDSSYTYWDLYLLLLEIYLSRKNTFKVNFGFGFILYHTISETYKYHYVSTNNLLFDKAMTITNTDDVANLMRHIIGLDLATNFYLKKPSSGWVLAGLTNVQFVITDVKNVPIGVPVELPAHIKNRKCV